MNNTKKAKGFEAFPIGTKVQSYDRFGYYIMGACGTVEKHLGNGHAIIKTFSGDFRSTVEFINRVNEIESMQTLNENYTFYIQQ
jgi:hypothetical protein